MPHSRTPTAAQVSTNRREGTTGLNLSGQLDQIQQKASDADVDGKDASGNGFNLANDLSGIESFINGLFK